VAAIFHTPGPKPAVTALSGKEPRPDQPDQALRFRRMQLEDERKQIPADGLLRAKAQMDAMREEQLQRAAAAGKPEGEEVARLIPSDWRWVGPGNVGGRIRAIAIHPTNASRIWVGSVSGGIWYSSDAGNSWRPVDDFMANLAISSLAIDPANPNIMYAGTGELFAASTPDGLGFAPDGLRGLGVFKSTDGGATWSQLPATNPADPAVCATGPGLTCAWSYVTRLSIAPNGAVIVAATGSGIWRSSDGGATWTPGAGAAGIFFDIDADPTNSQRAIASGGGFAGYSTNAGQNWTGATFTPAISLAGGGTGRVEVAYAPSNPATVYALVDQTTPDPSPSPSPAPSQPSQGALYRSTDGGQSYTKVNTTPGLGILGTLGGYSNILWVNPQDASVVVVGGLDLWRSTDSGASFTQISRWQCAPLNNGGSCAGISAHADHHMIVSAPGFNNTTNKTVYFGNDGGIYRTDDVLAVAQLSGWVSLNNNLGITQLYGGAAGPTGRLLGGTQDNGNVTNIAQPSPSPATINPQTWTTPRGAGGDGGYVAADPSDANYLYSEYVNLQIGRSSDGGASVTPIYCDPASITPITGVCTSSAGITDAGTQCGIPAGSCANFIAPFILDPNNSNRMLAGGTSLWRSNDVKTATTPVWTAIKEPYSFNMPPHNQAISAIAVAEGNSDFIVVGHNDGSIFLTRDGTAAATATTPMWAKIDIAGVPNRFVTRLVIDATRAPNWIYATFGGFSPDNVYVTKDLGATWLDVTGSGTTALPDVPIRSLLIHPVRPDFLYVGTEVGIFASEDAGATWQLPHGGPANVSVDELFWSNGSLTAATHGRGFYTTNNRAFAQAGGGSGIGAAAGCFYPSLTCPNNTCTPGWWDCPCTWNGPIPGPNDDVVVTCPVLVRSGLINPRNLRVNGRLDFASNASLIMPNGTLLNFGTIAGGSELRMGSLLNAGTITTRRLWAIGSLSNGGIIDASASWGSTETSYPIEANDITLGGHGSLSAQGVLCNGNLVIGPGASLRALGGSPQAGKAALFLHGNAANLGLLDVRGEFALSFGAQGATAMHTFFGTGEWKLGAFTVGDRTDPRFGGYATLTLASDLTLKVTGLPAFANNSMVVSAPATIKQNGNDLYLNASSLWNYGQIDVGAGALYLNSPSIKLGEPSGPSRPANLGPPGFVGAGTVNMAGEGNIFFEALQNSQPSFNLTSGTVDGRMGMTINGAFTVATGATFNINSGALRLTGTAVVNGTLGKAFGTPVGSALQFTGVTFTNNGSVSGDTFEFNYGSGSLPRNQTIAGAGAWPGARLTRVGFFNAATNLALANDMTLNWTQLSIYGGSTIQTGAFTLTMPCSTTFDPSSAQFINGEIIGNVRRTNIADCAGPIPFTSRFTTVQFDSGTPPTEMTISLFREPPPGFGNAVRRAYAITPLGGSAWTSTLRLSYLDAELNGNAEGSLALYRDTGSSWNPEGASVRSTTENWVEQAGVTQFSRWALSSAAPATGDSDGDGMADEFEQAYFGSPTAGDPALDSDGDGTSNLAEFRAGTVPTNPASVFKITSTSKIAGGAVAFSFSSVSGKSYRVDFRNSLGSGDWMPLQTNIAGTGANITITDNSAAGEPERFYRVVVLP